MICTLEKHPRSSIKHSYSNTNAPLAEYYVHINRLNYNLEHLSAYKQSVN